MKKKSAVFRVGKTDEDIGSNSITVLFREDKKATMSFSPGAIFETLGGAAPKQGARIKITAELLKE